MATPSQQIDQELEGFRTQLDQAQQLFERQKEQLGDLRFEADEAGLARDRALYWLFRICEAVHRGQLTLGSDELKEVNEKALDVLFDNNVYVGLDEPDAAILRLMEIATRDQEGQE